MLFLKLLGGHQLNMYDTDDWSMINDLQHDCLLYYVIDKTPDYDETSSVHRHQIIPYCIRMDTKIATVPNDGAISQKVSFDDLRKQNVSSHLLWKWSAPINLIEQYQFYLENIDILSSQQLFYNCTSPWFGSHCQYSFYRNYSIDDIVDYTLANNRFDRSFKDAITCYTHITCDRGPAPMCLDWREICDNKIDCINGGQDEEYCFVLELNECQSAEYRCHNGMHCIPNEFLRDDLFHPECIDQSDEVVSSTKISDYYQSICTIDISFLCEEHTCRPSPLYPFSCGDGQCAFAGVYSSNVSNFFLKYQTFRKS